MAIYCSLLLIASYCGAHETFSSTNASLSQMRKHRIPVFVELRRYKSLLILLGLAPIFMVIGILAMTYTESILGSRFFITSTIFYLIMLVLAMYFSGYYLFRRDMRRNWSISQAEGKPFVLYLRTFSVDAELITSSIADARWLAPIEKSFGRLFSVERVVFRAVNGRGLAGVAVGAPGEALPPLGFQRLYFSDAEWQKEVSSLIGRAAVIIVNCSPTHWVKWELEEIRRQEAVSKLILMTHARTASQRVEHLTFAVRPLGVTEAGCECGSYTIALSQLHKAEPMAIDAYSDDLFSFMDATTAGIYALIG
ncbi:MAG: hypothetical protein ACLPWS_16660 [Rhodomicrobium sp.]